MDYRRVLGIDIGSSTVKIMSGSIINSNEISVSGIGTAPLLGLEKGHVSDRKALSDSIKNAIECVKVATDEEYRSAFIGISSAVINSFNSCGSVAPLLSEKITAGDIERACTAAAITNVPDGHAVLHVLPQGFRVDGDTMYQAPVGYKGECLEVAAHVITIPKELVEILKEIVFELGIDSLGIFSNAIAAGKTVISTEQNVLTFDIGAGVTDIVLYHQGVVFFSASLPLGGSYITSDIALGLDTSFNTAEEIKRFYGRKNSLDFWPESVIDLSDYGIVDKIITYEFLSNIIESRVEEIVKLLKEYLEPVLSEFAIDQVLLMGGASMLPSTEKWFKSKFDLPVKIVLPQQLAAEYRNPSHTASYGVICYGAAELAETFQKESNRKHKTLLNKIRNLFNI